jgi:hypothetical protein
MRPVGRADKLATFICSFFENPGSLNVLEPLGPIEACTGIALPSACTDLATVLFLQAVFSPLLSP